MFGAARGRMFRSVVAGRSPRWWRGAALRGGGAQPSVVAGRSPRWWRRGTPPVHPVSPRIAPAGPGPPQPAPGHTDPPRHAGSTPGARPEHIHPCSLRRIVPGAPLCVKRSPACPPPVRAKTTFVAGGDRTMTACAIEPSTGHDDGAGPTPGCAIAADGSYAARLAPADGSPVPERWTLDGPEPYAVPLPGDRPEEPGTEVQPMGDGRVLIHRPVAGLHTFFLLYPTGPGTGELPLGAVECPDADTRLRLLPPAPGGERAYALAVGRRTSTVWLVAGGAFGPERVAELPGRCSGGVWLDRAGRMLALDRETGGRTKAVVVDLERDGEVS